MLAVPGSVMSTYLESLKLRKIPVTQVAYYQKWLRYFYDFSAKLPDLSSSLEQLQTLFLEKLRSKNQSEFQCRQAADAVALYNPLLMPTSAAIASDVRKSCSGHESIPPVKVTVCMSRIWLQATMGCFWMMPWKRNIPRRRRSSFINGSFRSSR